MREFTFHGITIHVLTDNEVGASTLREYSRFQSLRYLYFSRRMTNKEIVIMAGHDWSKVDPAVPIDWAWRQLDPQGYFWTYEGGELGGRPLSLRTAREGVETAIIRSLVEGDEDDSV